MTRKQKRLTMILGGLAVIGLAAGLVLYALSDTITFFHTPSDLAETGVQARPAHQARRHGGGRQREEGAGHDDLVLRDGPDRRDHRLLQRHPARISSARGRVSSPKASCRRTAAFVADTVLAKHDENYMPRELADSLKEKGVKLGKGAEEGAYQ